MRTGSLAFLLLEKPSYLLSKEPRGLISSIPVRFVNTQRFSDSGDKGKEVGKITTIDKRGRMRGENLLLPRNN